ncbi:MAG: hypothetical protein IIZ59_00175 [Clostridia bacterium]|nr:hypothetical protein [Clostridia bacterium]
MKTKNIFDKLENENTIIDSTVIENTGVSTERVMEMVKQEIGNTGKVVHMGKKRKTALKITALIAAALTASIVTASALDGFNAAFGSLFAGDSPDGLYSGGDLNIESENTNIEFLGIAGDDYVVAAAMKLRKNDGTAYVDDIENTWIAPSSTEELSDYLYGAFPTIICSEISDRYNIRYTTPAWFNIKYPDAVEEDGSRWDLLGTFGLYFDDPSTINAYIYSSTWAGGIRGETMTASADNISAYTVQEIVYDYSEHLDDNIDEYGDKVNMDFHAHLTEELQTFGTGEKNGVRVMVNPETSDIVLAHETPLDISFKLSVKMNYKNSSTEFEMKDLDKCFAKWNTGASGSLKVTPFNATLNVKLEEEMVHSYDEAKTIILGEEEWNEYLRAYRSNPETLTLTLDDGTTVTAFDEGWTADAGTTETQFTVLYQFFTDNGDGSRVYPIAIDPNKIVSIEAGGTIIYEK